MPPLRNLVQSLPFLIAASALACQGDGLIEPSLGTLEITTSTAGAEPDAGGYTVQVDGEPVQTIGPAGTVRISDIVGDHTVQLGGVAANCAVAGENPRRVALSAGDTTTVGFSVTCSASTGSLEVTAHTSGAFPDGDGYQVTIDGVARLSVSAGGRERFNWLASGKHAIGLSGVAANCQIQGPSPQLGEIKPGETTAFVFEIDCTLAPPIAFLSAGAIFLVNADGSGLIELTDGYAPAWSRDKTRIAFFDNGIWVIGADGNGRAKLTADLTQGLQSRIIPDPLQWSPDGTTIAFDVDASVLAEGCCPVDIWLARADGGGTRMLVANGSSPAWSPDGRKIAFTSSRDGNDEIYVINSDGSGITRLTDRPDFRDLSPRWSPDGARIVFQTQGIAVMNADGTGLMNLSGGSSGGSPVWLANGRIGFQTNGQIALMNPDGSGRTILTNEEGIHHSVAWAPDGSQVAFVRNVDRGGPVVDPELYVVNADGTGIQNISNRPDTFELIPDW